MRGYNADLAEELLIMLRRAVPSGLRCPQTSHSTSITR
jgi:hypothetical protein